VLLFGYNHYTVIIVATVFAVLLCGYWLLYYNNIFTLDIAYFLITHAYTHATLYRHYWALLNHFCTNQGHCTSCWKNRSLQQPTRGKHQMMSDIVNSCPQSKLEGGYSNCTQLMMLLLNVWKHTTINALDNNCYAESQWINGTVNCQIKKVLRYQPATQTTQQCKLITKKQ